jgi:hypothetical protein
MIALTMLIGSFHYYAKTPTIKIKNIIKKPHLFAYTQHCWLNYTAHIHCEFQLFYLNTKLLEVPWNCKISYNGKPAKYLKTPALGGFIRHFLFVENFFSTYFGLCVASISNCMWFYICVTPALTAGYSVNTYD